MPAPSVVGAVMRTTRASARSTPSWNRSALPCCAARGLVHAQAKRSATAVKCQPLILVAMILSLSISGVIEVDVLDDGVAGGGRGLDFQTVETGSAELARGEDGRLVRTVIGELAAGVLVGDRGLPHLVALAVDLDHGQEDLFELLRGDEGHFIAIQGLRPSRAERQIDFPGLARGSGHLDPGED